MRFALLPLTAALSALPLPALAWAQTAVTAAAPADALQPKIDAAKSWFGSGIAFNAGDNAWMMTSAALVLLMTGPGLALFYSGLVRRKNVLGTMMQSFALMALVSVIWAVYGFAVAFGDASPFWGGLKQFVLLEGVAWDPALVADGNRFPINGDYAPTISFTSFSMFQLMFAIITPALICGAYAERMKFSGMVLFSTLWLTFVYLPLAHMVWGKNGLFNWGFGATDWAAFDFAGGTVVHISSGVAALMCALFLGRRRGYPKTPMPPHSLVLSFIGACLLWVGWFGFNAGSALGASGLAALAFTNTHLAAAAAALGWAGTEWVLHRKATVLGAISGAVAGLVAITPAAGFVLPGSAMLIGLIGGLLCYVAATVVKTKLGYDDSLDAFGIHGVGGIWGALATGLFFNADANPALAALNEPLYRSIMGGEHPVVFNQLKAVLVAVVLSAVLSALFLFVTKVTVGLRVSEQDEEDGLDLTQHGEQGYHETQMGTLPSFGLSPYPAAPPTMLATPSAAPPASIPQPATPVEA